MTRLGLNLCRTVCTNRCPKEPVPPVINIDLSFNMISDSLYEIHMIESMRKIEYAVLFLQVAFRLPFRIIRIRR